MDHPDNEQAEKENQAAVAQERRLEEERCRLQQKLEELQAEEDRRRNERDELAAIAESVRSRMSKNDWMNIVESWSYVRKYPFRARCHEPLSP